MPPFSDFGVAHGIRREVFPQQEELFKKLAAAQNPRAMFITCAD